MGRRGRQASAVAGLAATAILMVALLMAALNRAPAAVQGPGATDAAALTWHSTRIAMASSLSPLLATSGARLFVLGSGGQQGSRTLEVRSSSDGLIWERLAVSGIENDFVSRQAIGDGSGGLIVVGELTPSESVIPQIWLAPDGHTFTRAQVDLSKLALGPGAGGIGGGSGEIVAVAGHAGRLAALGDHDFLSLDKSAGEVRSLDAWHSTDGRSWTRVDLPGSDGYQARSMTTWGNGFAALGSQAKDPEYAVWTSPDGIVWHRAATVPGLSGASIVEVPGRLVVLGSRKDTSLGMVPASWSSPDAISWTESDPPVSGVGASFDSATVVGGTIVAIGQSHVGNTDTEPGSPTQPPLVPPSAWVSSDGSSWRLLGAAPGYLPYMNSMAAFGGRVVLATSSGPTEITVSLASPGGVGTAAPGR